MIDVAPLSTFCAPDLSDQLGQVGAVDSDGDGLIACELGALEVQALTDELFSDRFESP